MSGITPLLMAAIMTIGGTGVLVSLASAQPAAVGISDHPPEPPTVPPVAAPRNLPNQALPAQRKPDEAPLKIVTTAAGNRYQLMPNGTMRLEDFASAGSDNPTFTAPKATQTQAPRITQSFLANRQMRQGRTRSTARIAR